MKTTSFRISTKILKRMGRAASIEKRSVTKQIEMVLEAWLKKRGR